MHLVLPDNGPDVIAAKVPQEITEEWAAGELARFDGSGTADALDSALVQHMFASLQIPAAGAFAVFVRLDADRVVALKVDAAEAVLSPEALEDLLSPPALLKPVIQHVTLDGLGDGFRMSHLTGDREAHLVNLTWVFGKSAGTVVVQSSLNQPPMTHRELTLLDGVVGRIGIEIDGSLDRFRDLESLLELSSENPDRWQIES